MVFNRQLCFVIYTFVTLITCREMFFSGSFSASGAGLHRTNFVPGAYAQRKPHTRWCWPRLST